MKKITTFCDICGNEIKAIALIEIKGKLSDIHYNYKDVCASCSVKILTTVFQIQADAKFDPDKMVKGWKQYLEKDCKAKNTSTAENCVHFMEELGCHKCIERYQEKKKAVLDLPHQLPNSFPPVDGNGDIYEDMKLEFGMNTN